MATEIQSTLNYELFKFILSNREINQPHLKKLKKSIQTKNYLYLFPIIINKDMEIVDGQHRLRAAVELGLPIFYMIDDKITKAQIAMVNSNRRGWATIDYVNFYAEEGVVAYKKALEIFTKYPKVPKIVAMQLMSDGSLAVDVSGNSIHYKEGKINDKHHAMAIKILDFAKSLDYDYAFNRKFILPFKSIALESSVEDVIKKIRSTALPIEKDGLTVYFSRIRALLSPKKSISKIEPIEPPKRKSYLKEGKELLDARDFRKDII